jgi:uncharacterized protein (DUF2062 family)
MIRLNSMGSSLWRRHLVAPLLDLLRQGITPDKIALSISLGIALGVFPVLGSTTVLCTVAAALLRLNLPAIQVVNWFTYPLQLALFLPLLRRGALLTGAQPVPFSLARIFDLIRENLWGAITTFWQATLGAIAIWLILGPITAAILYVLLAPLLRRLAATADRTIKT